VHSSSEFFEERSAPCERRTNAINSAQRFRYGKQRSAIEHPSLFGSLQPSAQVYGAANMQINPRATVALKGAHKVAPSLYRWIVRDWAERHRSLSGRRKGGCRSNNVGDRSPLQSLE
jgi:hypothetical protein